MSRRVGVRARKRFGQHFLEPSWAARVVDAIGPGAEDTFLEIGPGRGAITRPLALRSGRVVAVELDRDLAAGLDGEGLKGVTIVQGDFLTVDVETLSLPRLTRVAGNLPYNVSSPILFRLLDLARAPGRFRDATLMLQKEVADRLVASPGGKDYGPLAVFATLQATVSRLLTLPPGAFRPMPQVTSAIVRLAFPAEALHADIPATFSPLVRGIFTMRRKMLSNALAPVAQGFNHEAARLLADSGIDGRRRPETLTIEELLRLGRLMEAPPPSAG
jgi:16S rRNA (adenine1518-N6/adenine1519-N6)-dimethyltransferase